MVEWTEEINPHIHQDILAFEKIVSQRFGKQVLETIVSYNSLTIFFNNDENTERIIHQLKSVEMTSQARIEASRNSWLIPVCYDSSLGVDLGLISESLERPVNQIIELHAEAEYLVYFLGFLPGFMYLGGLDDRLYFPRKSKPREKVNKGDVGIGGEQTGIYPNDSPGGWNIIGRTPITLFDPECDKPCFVNPGDIVQFRPISLEEYSYLEREIKTGNFYKQSLLRNGQRH